MDESKIAWIAMNLVPAKPADRTRLLEALGDPVTVFGCNPENLLGVEGIGGALAKSVLGADWPARAEEECRRAEAQGFHILTPHDTIYPPALRVIPDPPPALYVLGELRREDALSIAVIGSRRPTSYGRETARAFGRGLAERGITVVSGMAIGLDAEAHRGALETGGRTLAVLGSGLDRPYPAANRRLMDRIARSGAVLSEFPLRTSPYPSNFPQRNRVIAGLALGTVVVEAELKSGSMGTVGQALDCGREVFAVPGRIDSKTSTGTNRLIHAGHALLVRTVQDVVDALPEHWKDSVRPQPEQLELDPEAAGLAEVEVRVLCQVGSKRPIHVDSLAQAAGLPTGALLDALLSLEMRRLVRPLPGGRYVRAAPGGETENG